MNKFFTCLSVLALVSSMAFAQSNFAYTAPTYGYDNALNYANSNLQGYALYVPANVTCRGVLSQSLSSESAVVGQSVDLLLNEDFVYNNTVIAPAGSIVYGSIVTNQKAGIGNRNAKMLIKFTTIRTPYNNIIPISAVIATSDSTGILKGGTAKDSAKEYLKDTVVGAGSGAALGTAMGALSSGSVGKGAVYGTALGAGIGLMKRVADRGEAINVPANSVIDILFTQPITLTAQ